MPQTHLAISLFSLESAFRETDPSTALNNLLWSVPSDEDLLKRVDKANAQHKLHGINRVLTKEDVETLAIASVYTSLEILMSVLPTDSESSISETVESQAIQFPDWATDNDKARILLLESRLENFEEMTFLGTY